MAQLKAGTRLRSAVCNTEVMVVLAPSGDVELTCGGTSMIDQVSNDAQSKTDHQHTDRDTSSNTYTGGQLVHTAAADRE